MQRYWTYTGLSCNKSPVFESGTFRLKTVPLRIAQKLYVVGSLGVLVSSTMMIIVEWVFWYDSGNFSSLWLDGPALIKPVSFGQTVRIWHPYRHWFERYKSNCFQGGQLVPSYKCTQPEFQVLECSSDCDRDCEFSAWTIWSQCDKTCGVAVATRYRRIIKQPIGIGKQCPNEIEQTMPCDNIPCVKWKAANWFPCVPYYGSCGWGVQFWDSTFCWWQCWTCHPRVTLFGVLFSIYLNL